MLFWRQLPFQINIFQNLPSVCVSVCARACTRACGVLVGAHGRLWAQRAAISFYCTLLEASTNLFETESLTETGDWLIWLGWLSRESKASAYVHLPSSEITGSCHHTGFVVLLYYVAFEPEMQALMPTRQAFYQLSPVPSPTRTIGLIPVY